MSQAEQLIHNSVYALLMGALAVIATSVGFLASHWVTSTTVHAAPLVASAYSTTLDKVHTVALLTERVNWGLIAEDPVPPSF